jgi:glycosyltransferase involved in cell wall biosynthesis
VNANVGPFATELVKRRSSPRLKVAFVMHPFQAPRDSVSTHIWVHEVARRLAGTYSTIVYTGRRQAEAKEEVRDGVVYRRMLIPTQTCWAEFLFGLPILWRLKGSIPQHSNWYYWGHALRTARDIRAESCDVVHVLNLPNFASIIRVLNPEAKIVLHMHAGMSGPSGSVRRHLKRIDRIISCSEFFTDRVRNEFPEFSTRCTTIYNGVDVERFSPGTFSDEQSEVKQLLYVGMVSPHKGLHVLIDALALVRRQHPDVKLYIIGPPWQLPAEFLSIVSDPEEVTGLLRFYHGNGYLAHLKEQIARLNLTDSVKFLGLIPNNNLTPYYRKATVFVFPSVCNEAFGMPVAEAMASAIPVVASRAAGLSEVVGHEETGLLVKRGNVAELAHSILRLLKDENLRRSMGRAGRERALRNFTWDRIAGDTARQYEQLLAPGKEGMKPADMVKPPVGAEMATCGAEDNLFPRSNQRVFRQ